MSRSRSSEQTAPVTETLGINEIKPYWRNPRVIPDEAVEAVKASIEEFGYVQPIVVDSKGVIVIGHTRYIALRRMGATQVEVVRASLSERQAKELRIIDNRSAEFSSWDYIKLTEELDEAQSATLRMLYPDVNAADVPRDDPFITTPAETGTSAVDLICPSCFHEWEQPVTREQIFEGKVTL